MKNQNFMHDRNYDQLEILKSLNREEEKREKRINLFLGSIGFILFDLIILIPIALIYFQKMH